MDSGRRWTRNDGGPGTTVDPEHPAAACCGRNWMTEGLPVPHNRRMTSTGPPGRRLTLIFDADDTLWENNALFERVVEDYLDWLAHPTMDRTELRSIVDDVEAANIADNGYGAKAFLRNLAITFEKLSSRTATAEEVRQIENLAEALLHHDIELMPGVVEVLEQLRARHDLYLLTKGAPDEQRRKIDASGLAGYFSEIHVVPEKDEAVYRALAVRHHLDREVTWMIGNSPKSDILPARAAGLNAVFIPHRLTWVLERAEIDHTDEKVLVLDSFSGLLDHF